MCVKCGNTGVLLNGKLCDCNNAKGENETTFENAAVDFIPKEYIGMTFNEAFIKPTADGYAPYLQGLYNRICTDRIIDRNLFISSPRGRSKQMFVYSALQSLAKRGVPVFPYIDVGEVGRYIRDIDHAKVPKFLAEHSIDPDTMYGCPILFVKGTMAPANETLIHLAMLIDRRTRRGNHTILFSHQRWEGFTTNDIYGSVRPLQGDGLFGTIEVKEWGYVAKSE